MAWLSSGRIANPAIDQVILDTGPLPAGAYWFTAQGSGSVAAAMEVQLRDAANATTVKSQIIANPAFGTSPPFEVPERFQFNVNVNERIRVIMVAAVTGSVSVSLVGNF
jgi:hypothetical protein